jgi:spore coat protein CotH
VGPRHGNNSAVISLMVASGTFGVALMGCRGAATCGEEDSTLGADDLPFGDAMPLLEIELSADARAALPSVGRDAGEDVEATLRWDTESWLVGLNLKGNTSFRDIDHKASFKIDLGEFEDSSFFGVRRLTLNNMIQDRSKLTEALVYGLYATMGLPAPQRGYACVTVNGADYGLYSIVETMDEQFLERAFDDPNGNLYDRQGEGDLDQGHWRYFEVEEQGDGDGEPLADIHELVGELEASESALSVFEAQFDSDALLTAMAIDIALSAPDSYTLNTNNFLLYHELEPGRWWLLPWGMDQAFSGDADAVTMSGDRPGVLAERCLGETDCRDQLVTAIQGLAGPIEDMADKADALEDMISRIARQDPLTETANSDRKAALRQLGRFLRDRPDALRALD